MVIRTACKRAYLQGEGEKRKEWGISTVIMNKRGNPCPKCLPWVGKILIDDVWSGGSAKDGNYPLMSEAIKTGLYHPRCRDSHTTYFPEISEPPDDKWRKAELEEIEMWNKAEEKQQYAKRQEERFRRLEEFSLDEENKRIYEHRADKWEKSFVDGGVKEESYRTKRSSSSEFGVKWNVIKSKEYNKRFDELSNNSKANELAVKHARNMLSKRDGKKTEELYAISLDSGKDISSITNQNYDFGVKRTEKFTNRINEAIERGEHILYMHNHPRGLPPSVSDLNELVGEPNSIGITIGHNGSIYLYSSPNKEILMSDIRVANKKMLDYNYDLEDDELFLKVLSEIMEFEFEKL